MLFEMPDLVADDDDDDDDEDEEDRGPTYKEITDDRVSADVDGVEVEDVEEDNTTDDPEPEVPIESDLRANEQRSTRATSRLGPEIRATRARDRARRRDRPDEETVD